MAADAPEPGECVLCGTLAIPDAGGTCSRAGCPSHENIYHTHCFEDYVRKIFRSRVPKGSVPCPIGGTSMHRKYEGIKPCNHRVSLSHVARVLIKDESKKAKKVQAMLEAAQRVAADRRAAKKAAPPAAPQRAPSANGPAPPPKPRPPRAAPSPQPPPAPRPLLLTAPAQAYTSETERRAAVAAANRSIPGMEPASPVKKRKKPKANQQAALPASSGGASGRPESSGAASANGSAGALSAYGSHSALDAHRASGLSDLAAYNALLGIYAASDSDDDGEDEDDWRRAASDSGAWDACAASGSGGTSSGWGAPGVADGCAPAKGVGAAVEPGVDGGRDEAAAAPGDALADWRVPFPEGPGAWGSDASADQELGGGLGGELDDDALAALLLGRDKPTAPPAVANPSTAAPWGGAAAAPPAGVPTGAPWAQAQPAAPAPAWAASAGAVATATAAALTGHAAGPALPWLAACSPAPAAQVALATEPKAALGAEGADDDLVDDLMAAMCLT